MHIGQQNQHNPKVQFGMALNLDKSLKKLPGITQDAITIATHTPKKGLSDIAEFVDVNVSRKMLPDRPGFFSFKIKQEIIRFRLSELAENVKKPKSLWGKLVHQLAQNFKPDNRIIEQYQIPVKNYAVQAFPPIKEVRQTFLPETAQKQSAIITEETQKAMERFLINREKAAAKKLKEAQQATQRFNEIIK